MIPSYDLLSCSWHQLPNSPINDFCMTIFIYSLFFLDWNHPTFLDLEGESKCISQHHWNNHNTKFCKKNIRGLVKINWIDTTNKILKESKIWSFSHLGYDPTFDNKKFCLMSGSSHNRSFLIGVEYRNCHQTLDV